MYSREKVPPTYVCYENTFKIKVKTKLIKVKAFFECGCCHVIMKFKSKSSAEKAFKKAGLGNDQTVVDDKNVVYEKIDTFYGFSLES